VVARLGEEVTVKRFKRTRTGIELIPENPDFQTIVVPAGGEDNGFELEGLAVGLIRNNMLG
jgi:repressor LexA